MRIHNIDFNMRIQTIDFNISTIGFNISTIGFNISTIDFNMRTNTIVSYIDCYERKYEHTTPIGFNNRIIKHHVNMDSEHN